MTKIGEMPYLNSEIFYLNRVSDFEYIKLTPKKMGVSISDKKINAGPLIPLILTELNIFMTMVMELHLLKKY